MIVENSSTADALVPATTRWRLVPKIAYSYRLRVAVFKKGIVDLIAAIAEADIAHTNSFIRAKNLRIAERCDRARPDKLPSSHAYTISDPYEENPGCDIAYVLENDGCG